MVGLFTSPLSFLRPARSAAGKVAATVLLNLISPCAVLLAGAAYWDVGVAAVLREAAVGWTVCGTYSAVVVWCVWWPAWVVGGLVVLGGGAEDGKGKVKSA